MGGSSRFITLSPSLPREGHPFQAEDEVLFFFSLYSQGRVPCLMPTSPSRGQTSDMGPGWGCYCRFKAGREGPSERRRGGGGGGVHSSLLQSLLAGNTRLDRSFGNWGLEASGKGRHSPPSPGGCPSQLWRLISRSQQKAGVRALRTAERKALMCTESPCAPG